MLTFDPDAHEYRFDGEPVMSVTQIIGAAWPELYQWSNDYARDRGSRAHGFIADDIQLNSVPEWTITAEVEGYVRAARVARRELNVEIERVESRIYSPTYRYAGTLDIKGRIGRRHVILDWKTGEPGWQTGLQTAAYAHAWQEEHREPIGIRLGVWLHNDGTYQVTEYKDKNDWTDFCAALRVVARRKVVAA